MIKDAEGLKEEECKRLQHMVWRDSVYHVCSISSKMIGLCVGQSEVIQRRLKKGTDEQMSRKLWLDGSGRRRRCRRGGYGNGREENYLKNGHGVKDICDCVNCVSTRKEKEMMGEVGGS